MKADGHGKMLRRRGQRGVKVGTVIALIAGEDSDARPEACRNVQPRHMHPFSLRLSQGPEVEKAGSPLCHLRSRRPRQAKPGCWSPCNAATQPTGSLAGREMVKTTVREALRDAMAEEMRSRRPKCS